MTSSVITANGGSIALTGVATDSGGDTFFVGTLHGTANIGGAQLSSTSGTGGSGYVAKFNANGTLAWAKLIGGATGNAAYSDTATALTVDPTGNNVYVGVSYIGTLNLPGGGTLVSPSTNNYGAVLDLSGTTGNTTYDIKAGSTVGSGINQIVLDGSGNLYVTGGMYDENSQTAGPATISFTGGSGSPISITGVVSQGHTYDGRGLFTLKASASTGTLAWVQQVDTGSGDVNGSAIAVDTTGNVYMVGQYANVHFGNSTSTATLQTPNSGSSFGGFVAKLSASGAFQWEQGITGGTVSSGGASGVLSDSVTGVAVDSSGNPIITGSFTDGAKLNPGSSTTQTGVPTSTYQFSPGSPPYLQGASRAFVEKFNSTGTSQWVATEAASGTPTAKSYDSPTNIVVDSAGNIVTTGVLNDTANNNAVFGTHTITHTAAIDEAYLWTLSDAGSTLGAGAFTTTGTATVGGLAVSLGIGNVVVALNATTTTNAPPGATADNVSPGTGGGILVTNIVDTGGVACFAAGTMIDTPHGGRAVEALRPGDLVTLARGGTAPVRWIGHRHFDQPARHVQPLRVAPDAFGPGLPQRPLYLSRGHAVFLRDVLVPIWALEDGQAIARVSVPEVSYFHILLDRHDAVLAEGLPAETWIEDDDSIMFDNAGGIPVAWLSAWPFAPRLTQGVVVQQIREGMLVAA